VVLIDPRPERLAITRLIVEASAALTVVGAAADLAEAEVQIQAEQADIALLEIQLPVAQGLEAIAALRGQFPKLTIIVCSFHDDRATRQATQEQGADGYLVKPLSVRDLVALTRRA
jgi:DNA-binding NarL/FixJ family response regulator